MAQLDPSIILGSKPMQIESPVNQLAKVLQVQEMQQQGQMRGMQMQDAQDARTKRNRLAQLLQGGDVTPETLMRGGFMEESQALSKSQRDSMKTDADIGKTKAETEKHQIANALAKIEAVSQVMGGVRDQATYDQARAIAQQNGWDVSQMPAQYDPQLIEQKRQQGMHVKDQLEQAWKAKGYDLDVRKQTETERNNRTQNAISQGNLNVSRGNLALSGQRLAFDKAQPKGVLDTERGLLVDPRTGEARPVTMGGNAVGMKFKPMTEGQAKANLFGTRMTEADKTLRELEGKYSPMAVNAKTAAEETPLIGGLLGATANAALGENGQMAEQAQRDFVNAVLRRESGAAIAASEFQNAKKQYLPQPNDSKAVLQQKARNRQLAIEGMQAEIPGGFRTAPTTKSPTGTGKYKILSVEE